MVAVSTVKTEDGKVSCETPEGTVINININQRSCMESLLDAIKNARMVKKDGPNSQPGRVNQPTKVYLGVGVSLMSLGFVSVMLAIIIQVASVDLSIYCYGIHFWVGIPTLVAGVLNVVAYKSPKALWAVIALISLLVCLAVCIAGMVFISNHIGRYAWGNPGYLCDNIYQRQNGYYDQTTAPSYKRYDDNRSYYLTECKRKLQQYENLLLGLAIMSLLMMTWGLCVSAITVAYRLKVFFSTCRCGNVEEKDDPMLPPNPTNDIIIA